MIDESKDRENNAFGDWVETLPEKWQKPVCLAAAGLMFGLPIAGVIWLFSGPHTCEAARQKVRQEEARYYSHPTNGDFLFMRDAQAKETELCRKSN
jgi:hypothetical protein